MPAPDRAPAQLVTGPDGDLWFTEDMLEPLASKQAGHIGHFSPATPDRIVELALSPGHRQDAIAAGPDGNVWFAEMDLGADPQVPKIGRITPQGDTTEFAMPAPADRPPGPPNGDRTREQSAGGITGGPDGNVWFTLNGHQNVLGPPAITDIGRITPAGTVTLFPFPSTNVSIDVIVPGPDGNLWFPVTHTVDEQPVTKLGRIAPDGTITELSGYQGLVSGAMVAGPDGTLWMVQPGERQDKLLKITTSGEVVAEIPFPSRKSVEAMTVGRDGTIWFAAMVNGLPLLAASIGRITPAGDVTELPTRQGAVIPSIVAGPDGAIWFTENTQKRCSARIVRIAP